MGSRVPDHPDAERYHKRQRCSRSPHPAVVYILMGSYAENKRMHDRRFLMFYLFLYSDYAHIIPDAGIPVYVHLSFERHEGEAGILMKLDITVR